jgi:hypothetical protein
VPLDVEAEARQAVARRDWAAAALLLRSVIAREPSRLTAHYHLAVAASHLDLRDEAVREFRWVLAHAAAGSEEAEAARRWLADAGLLASPRSTDPPADWTTGDGSLGGRVVWTRSGEPPVDPRRLQLHLIGLPGSPTAQQRYVLRTDETGRFQFRRVVAGPYRLTNRVAGPPTWRLKVDVPSGRELALDLTPENSVPARDDFPNLQ